MYARRGEAIKNMANKFDDVTAGLAEDFVKAYKGNFRRGNLRGTAQKHEDDLCGQLLAQPESQDILDRIMAKAKR
ncbi:unnamed protein product [Amoebophrya sp. A120]|nr:unnamed protein product [Amoebophrya sp. A120]|eukprot:GSA120T00002565001.1